MKFIRLNLSAVVALAAAGAGDIVHAQCSGYSVDFLSGPDCQFESSSATAIAINDDGQLCGAYYACDKTGEAAVWLGQGSWIPLVSFPKGVDDFAPLDINSSRQMAGHTTTQHPLREAAIYDFDTSTFLQIGTLPGGNWSEGKAINGSGTVCGFSTGNSQPFSAVIWQSGRISPLTLPFGPDSVAYDISDTGKICGWMGIGPHIDGHAFIHDLDTQTTVDAGVLLAGAIGSEAMAVNNFGVICGNSVIPCGELCNLRRGFIWINGQTQDLGVLPGKTLTSAKAINDSNVIVGFCAPGTLAFVWRDGAITALNDLIPTELNLNMQSAYDINNAGQIVGDARIIGTSEEVAVRLTPIPSPFGDINCDSVINVDDLLGVINHWADQKPKGSNALPQGDFTHDGMVDFSDLMIVIDNWS